jgi:serine/threonine protein phosphatase 1
MGIGARATPWIPPETDMPPRIIAIGDIHGCSRALVRLLEAIDPRSDDLFVPLGDYVDRGPDSKGVIDRILELEQVCEVQPILGNHEEMMRVILAQQASPSGWLRYGGVATLESYGFDGDLSVVPEAHRDFLSRCLDYYETDCHFFVHGNYLHDVPLAELDPEILRWRSLVVWTPPPHQNGKVAVLGHTPEKSGEILDVGYLKCLDTFCYGGKWLTALDVTTGRIWQANQNGAMRAT